MKNSENICASSLASNIKNRIKGGVAIVGIGNILRGDDGLGPKLIEFLKTKAVKAHLFDCGTAPENYILPILSTNCDTIILIDAADFSDRPADIQIFDVNEISRVSFSTHSPSPRLLVDLLNTGKDNLNTFIISIQPKITTLGEGLSEDVKASLVFLADTFKEILG